MKLTRWMALGLLGLLIAASAQAGPVKIYTGTIGSDQFQWGTANPAGPADAWAAFDNMPVALMDHMVCSDGENIYVLGGYVGAGSVAVNKYNPLRKAWTALTDMPVSLSTTDAVLIGDTIYVAGGYNYTASALVDTLLKYSISGNTWTGAPGNHSGFYWSPEVVALKGKLYYISGCAAPGATAPSRQTWVYTPGVGWALGDSLNVGRVFAQAAVYHDTIWLAGGNAESAPLNHTEFFDPISGQWTVDNGVFPQMPVAIWGAAEGVAGDSLFIASGATASPLSDSCQYFDFKAKAWVASAGGIQPRYRTDGVGYLDRAFFMMGGSSGSFTPTVTVQMDNLGPKPDAAVLSIVDPKFPTYPAAYDVYATVRVANLGDAPATVPVRLEVFNHGVAGYNSVINVDLDAFHDTTFTFVNDGIGPVGGQYCFQYTTELPGDADPGNDQSIQFLSVSEWAAMPQTTPYAVRGYGTGFGTGPNGHPTVYVIGGGTGLDSCLGYDITDNAWINYAHMPGTAYYPASVTHNGKIYVMSGWGTTGNYIYDIAANSWSSGTPVPFEMQAASAVACKGRYIYLLGGGTGWTPQNYVLVYDIITNSWSQATPMPGARIGGAGACVGDRYLVYSCGTSSSNSYSNTWVGEIDPYDPTVIVWQEKSPCPAGGGYRIASTTLDNVMFMTGGADSATGGYRTATLAYNPEFDAWLSLAGKITGMSNISCTPGPNGVYVPGGYNGSAVNTFEVYTMMPHLLGVQGQPADKPLPYKLSLGVNPNPCNSRATISFQIPKTGLAELAVYNITGQKVRTLLSGRLMAGNHGFVWDGLNENGKPVASGSYLAVLKADGKQASQRLVLIK